MVLTTISLSVSTFGVVPLSSLSICRYSYSYPSLSLLIYNTVNSSTCVVTTVIPVFIFVLAADTTALLSLLSLYFTMDGLGLIFPSLYLLLLALSITVVVVSPLLKISHSIIILFHSPEQRVTYFCLVTIVFLRIYLFLDSYTNH